MCVTFLYFNSLKNSRIPYKLIVLNNRDEVLDRPTSKAAWENGVLAGRDEESAERGTWFGVTRTGKVGILLSITQPEAEKMKHSPSRGLIVNEYLRGSYDPIGYCESLKVRAAQFNGFQFLAMQKNSSGTFELTSLTNQLVSTVEPVTWPEGIYGFGNSPRSKPFRKVVYGEKLFTDILASFENGNTEEHLISDLLGMAQDRTRFFPDEQISVQTGRPEEGDRFLTSLFVEPEHRYGTRSHSIFLVDKNDQALFYERRMAAAPPNLADAQWETTLERFQLVS
ncbi:Protein Y80D3A.9 [Aphelenchoides avenae]|nr:Protein Y80D3A.9 [Aphelenchus avenae]